MVSPHTRQVIRGCDCFERDDFALCEKAAIFGFAMAGDDDKIGGGASMRLRFTACTLSVVKVDSVEAMAASVRSSWACSIGMFA